jgi:hypothetical protein
MKPPSCLAKCPLTCPLIPAAWVTNSSYLNDFSGCYSPGSGRWANPGLEGQAVLSTLQSEIRLVGAGRVRLPLLRFRCSFYRNIAQSLGPAGPGKFTAFIVSLCRDKHKKNSVLGFRPRSAFKFFGAHPDRGSTTANPRPIQGLCAFGERFLMNKDIVVLPLTVTRLWFSTTGLSCQPGCSIRLHPVPET